MKGRKDIKDRLSTVLQDEVKYYSPEERQMQREKKAKRISTKYAKLLARLDSEMQNHKMRMSGDY